MQPEVQTVENNPAPGRKAHWLRVSQKSCGS